MKVENINYFYGELPNLLKNPELRFKYLVFSSLKIQDVFETFSAALKYAALNCPIDEFVIQQVLDEKDIVNFIHAIG